MRLPQAQCINLQPIADGRADAVFAEQVLEFDADKRVDFIRGLRQLLARVGQRIRRLQRI